MNIKNQSAQVRNTAVTTTKPPTTLRKTIYQSETNTTNEASSNIEKKESLSKRTVSQETQANNSTNSCTGQGMRKTQKRRDNRLQLLRPTRNPIPLNTTQQLSHKSASDDTLLNRGRPLLSTLQEEQSSLATNETPNQTDELSDLTNEDQLAFAKEALSIMN